MLLVKKINKTTHTNKKKVGSLLSTYTVQYSTDMFLIVILQNLELEKTIFHYANY